MKKIFLVICALILTGCKNKLICTSETADENYTTQQKIEFTFDDDDNVVDATVNYIMTFEDEETAKSYLNIFETLEEDYEINIDKNKIDIKSSKNYEQYDQNKNELKEELEQNGYMCN